jgi:DNA modification methylase
LPTIARIIIWIKDHIEHISLSEFIVWNKRFRVASDNGKENPHFGYLSGYLAPERKRNYEKMAEYMLYYTFDNSWKILRERKKRGLSQKEIAEKVLSHTGGITGWVSNVEKGFSYPNPEQMKVIEDLLGLSEKDIITKFNNQGTHHSVWDIPIADREDHETPKPKKLIKTVLDHSSDKGDLVVIPFSGSGNVEVVCKKYGRKFIGFDVDLDYVKQAQEKLRQNYIGEYFK